MQKWIKIVSADEITDGSLYFIGVKQGDGVYSSGVAFWSQPLNGKRCFSSKAGIAVRYSAQDTKEMLTKNPQTIAILVPDDADKRWRARKKVVNYA